MTSVPNDQAERERRADAFLAQIPNDDLGRLADAIATLLISSAKARAATNPAPLAPTPKRTRRRSPSMLAKWEAAWQSEQASAEAES